VTSGSKYPLSRNPTTPTPGAAEEVERNPVGEDSRSKIKLRDDSERKYEIKQRVSRIPTERCRFQLRNLHATAQFQLQIHRKPLFRHEPERQIRRQ
jgi:hypothetical protein